MSRNIESSARGHDSENGLKGLFDDLDVNSNKFGETVEKKNAKLANAFFKSGMIEAWGKRVEKSKRRKIHSGNHGTIWI